LAFVAFEQLLDRLLEERGLHITVETAGDGVFRKPLAPPTAHVLGQMTYMDDVAISIEVAHCKLIFCRAWLLRQKSSYSPPRPFGPRSIGPPARTRQWSGCTAQGSQGRGRSWLPWKSCRRMSARRRCCHFPAGWCLCIVAGSGRMASGRQRADGE
jgi:hypothetical protein